MKTKNKKPEKSIDPYTGEKTREAQDAGKVTELMPLESDNRTGEDYLLKEESSMDKVSADADSGVPAERAARYTDDQTVKNIFEERQKLASSGRKVLEDDLEAHHSQSPKLTGGDLDASWQSANASGDETVGGTAPTPDQNVVDELGEAVGLTYADDEPLGSEEKLLRRDRGRPKGNPQSGDRMEE